jgi:hypothetical protein
MFLIAGSFSPDRSGNPFHFFFKNEKIVTDSWEKLQIKKPSCLKRDGFLFIL